MTLSVYSSTQTTLGIGKEGTFGVPAAPVMGVPWTQFKPADQHTPIPDLSWRASMADVYGYTPGPLDAAAPVGGVAYPDTIGYPLAGVLGDVVSSGSAPTTHQISVLNGGNQQPSSYTLTSTDGVNTLQWPGCRFSELTLDASSLAAGVEWSAKVSSLAAVPASASPSPVFTTAQLVPAWQLVAQIGGVTTSAVLGTTITITRAITAKRNVDGSRAPYAFRASTVAVTGKLVVLMQTDQVRAEYVAGTQTSLDWQWNQGSGAAFTQLWAHCSQVIFTSAAKDYASQRFAQWSIGWKAVANVNDNGLSGGFSPIMFTLQNPVPPGTY